MKKKQYNCPVCSNSKTYFFLTAYNSHGSAVYNLEKQFNYWKCSLCEALFLVNIKPSPDYYRKYYSKDYRDEHANIGMSAYIIRYSNYIKLSIIKHFIKENTKILDIGSGDGTFLKQLGPLYKRFGLEIEKNLTSDYKKHLITAIHGDIVSIPLKTRDFNCITLWHVIEHIPNPQKLFKKILEISSHKSIVIVSTPNIKSIGFAKGKEDWFHLDAPRHFILFSDKSIKILADKYGFEIVTSRNNWHDFPLDLFWSLKNYPHRFWYYIMYPLFKFIDTETITYVLQKV
jgi:SAM-dependent methyltransferase